MKRNTATIYRNYSITKLSSNRYLAIHNQKLYPQFEEVSLNEAKHVIDIRYALNIKCALLNRHGIVR